MLIGQIGQIALLPDNPGEEGGRKRLDLQRIEYVCGYRAGVCHDWSEHIVSFPVFIATGCIGSEKKVFDQADFLITSLGGIETFVTTPVCKY